MIFAPQKSIIPVVCKFKRVAEDTNERASSCCVNADGIGVRHSVKLKQQMANIQAYISICVVK